MIIFRAYIAIFLCLFAISTVISEETSAKKTRLIGQDYGYFYNSSLWPPNFDGRTNIPVCWEQNILAQYPIETAAVKKAIEQSWQKYSRISFIGWQKCQERNNGVRITVLQTGARVKAFGKNLNDVTGGMELNFGFDNWNEACKLTETERIDCIRAIAVHEFGHAIGFAHEQDRADTPGECSLAMSTGSTGIDLTALTPYDPESVMNYCNPNTNNNGVLSQKDIESLQLKYGRPERAHD